MHVRNYLVMPFVKRILVVRKIDHFFARFNGNFIRNFLCECHEVTKLWVYQCGSETLIFFYILVNKLLTTVCGCDVE